MKQPINEIERLKLIAGLINEVNYTDAVYGVDRNTKTTLTEAKKEKTLHIDVANPYEFRHGIQYELEQMDDYSDEALEKAKVTVLKNLAKDANYYFNLLNQQPTGFEFKATETDAPGMQANADGTLKKGAGKLEKANVKDSLNKSEAAKGKPKGVKELTDKGVEGKEKVVKEGIEEHHNDPSFPGGTKIHAMLDKVADEWGKDSDVYSDLEDTIVGWSDRNGELSPKGVLAIKALLSNWDMLDDYEQFLGEDIESDPVNGDSSAEGQFNQLMSKYDWYYEMSDDPRKYDTGSAMDQKLKSLAKTIGVDKAVELFNASAPSDRKVTTTFFAEGEDKHAKLKEMLKAGLKKKVNEDDKADEIAKKSAIQTEKAKLIALNKQKSELLADKNKPKEVKDIEIKGIDLKMRSANDSLTKLNSGKVDVV